MKVIVHLGAHRCATTSFQSMLWDNRGALAGAGLTCWTPPRTRDGLLQGLIKHPMMATIQDDRDGLRSIGRIRMEARRLEAAGQDALLVSEENIAGSMVANLRETRLYPLMSERLRRLAAGFEGRPITIGLSIRSYDAYWASCMSHLLVKGHPRPNADQLDRLTTQPRRWRTLVRDIAKVFPQARIVVWPFERYASAPRDVLDLFWQSDDLALTPQQPWANKSQDVTALNEVLSLRGEAPLMSGDVAPGTRWMPFSDDQRAVLHAEYRRDLAWLSAGAEGLATYASKPRNTPETVRPGHTAPTSPDRVDTSSTVPRHLAQPRGHNNGIEKGLG